MLESTIRNAVGNKTFSVEFIKRTTNTKRKMVCRLGVKKHLKGGSKPYKASDHNLLTVYSFDSQAYRTIPLDAITEIKCGEFVERVLN